MRTIIALLAGFLSAVLMADDPPAPAAPVADPPAVSGKPQGPASGAKCLTALRELGEFYRDLGRFQRLRELERQTTQDMVDRGAVKPHHFAVIDANKAAIASAVAQGNASGPITIVRDAAFRTYGAYVALNRIEMLLKRLSSFETRLQEGGNLTPELVQELTDVTILARVLRKGLAETSLTAALNEETGNGLSNLEVLPESVDAPKSVDEAVALIRENQALLEWVRRAEKISLGVNYDAFSGYFWMLQECKKGLETSLKIPPKTSDHAAQPVPVAPSGNGATRKDGQAATAKPESPVVPPAVARQTAPNPPPVTEEGQKTNEDAGETKGAPTEESAADTAAKPNAEPEESPSENDGGEQVEPKGGRSENVDTEAAQRMKLKAIDDILTASSYERFRRGAGGLADGVPLPPENIVEFLGQFHDSIPEVIEARTAHIATAEKAMKARNLIAVLLTAAKDKVVAFGAAFFPHQLAGHKWLLIIRVLNRMSYDSLLDNLHSQILQQIIPLCDTGVAPRQVLWSLKEHYASHGLPFLVNFFREMMLTPWPDRVMAEIAALKPSKDKPDVVMMQKVFRLARRIAANVGPAPRRQLKVDERARVGETKAIQLRSVTKNKVDLAVDFVWALLLSVGGFEFGPSAINNVQYYLGYGTYLSDDDLKDILESTPGVIDEIKSQAERGSTSAKEILSRLAKLEKSQLEKRAKKGSETADPETLGEGEKVVPLWEKKKSKEPPPQPKSEPPSAKGAPGKAPPPPTSDDDAK